MSDLPACTTCDSHEKACHCETAALRAAVEQLARHVQKIAHYLMARASSESEQYDLQAVIDSADEIEAML